MGVVLLSFESEKPQVQSADKSKDKDEITGKNLGHPINLKRDSASQRRREKVPDHNRRNKDKEPLGYRAPRFGEEHRPAPEINGPARIGRRADGQVGRVVPDFTGLAALSGRGAVAGVGQGKCAF